jgi:heme/copper-type cytochrome/quinol oxidase subunit 3
MYAQHNYHLVDPSPWPFFSSWSLFYLALGGASLFHFFINGPRVFDIGFILLISILSVWWRDVVREGTFNLHHTLQVQKSLRLGMVLFIVSEVLFFFAFFWAFFHSSLAPTHVLGSVWPPVAIEVFSPFGIPLLNTCLLLASGAAITLAHHALIAQDRDLCIGAQESTIQFAILFTGIQAYEYFAAPFSIYDGIYASTFYLATGFHGLHVIIGTLFILVSYNRYRADHFTPKNHFGFEAAAWYWHFVDVVWLFLFISIYYWGNLS